jgi:hypothetical protein
LDAGAPVAVDGRLGMSVAPKEGAVAKIGFGSRRPAGVVRGSLSAGWALLALAALWLAVGSSAAWAQRTTGSTGVRLDVVDLEEASAGKFYFYVSFLDGYQKPLEATDTAAWTVQFDGEKAGGKLSVGLLRDLPNAGVSAVVVLARYGPFAFDGLYEHAHRGAVKLLNGLNPDTDAAGAVVYGNNADPMERLTRKVTDARNWLTERGEAQPDNATPALMEAIDRAVDMFPAKAGGAAGVNRTVIIVTDGFDKDQLKPDVYKDRIESIQKKAEKGRVRLSILGVAIETNDQLKEMRALSERTGGTYREARTAADIETLLGHALEELRGQHVLTLETGDFQGEKLTTFAVEVSSEGETHRSNKVVSKVPKKDSQMGRYLLIGGIVLGGLIFLFILLKLISKLAGARREEVVVDTGPGLIACRQCNNQISPDWKVCKYCEALPHYGRLTVSSSGELNGRAFFIKESQTTVGKDPSNHILIEHGTVSKRHAGISVRDNKFELADFASTNKTWVNGQEIHKQFLKDGDEVGFGAVKALFKLKK